LSSQTLQRIAEFAGARAATLVVKNDDGGLGYSRYAGLTRPFASNYVDFYGQMDPTQFGPASQRRRTSNHGSLAAAGGFPQIQVLQ
jgi:hypothetical protein